ncbi:hypothetical protein ACH5RR_024086 [Cinchona calisaya]|uniref:Uncharacterized protein n=1 Tax=Cinchona calisaya TaxID=153742 RepID=A0ABD2ZCJ1_9GENT
MLGNGQSVDLFELYLNVQKKGGFEKVSKNRKWDSVAEECEFHSCFGLALKLIYVKYLQGVVRGEDSERVVKESGSDCSGELLMDLESDMKGYECGGNKKDGDFMSVELRKKEFDFECGGKFARLDEIGGFVKANRDVGIGGKNKDGGGRGGVVSVNGERSLDDVGRLYEVNIEKEGKIEDGDSVLDLSGGKEDVLSRKRRRESYLGMLNWMNKVARDPCDPAIGFLPDKSKWKYYATDLVWKQVLSVREAMLLKRNSESSDQQSILQKKQKMHPIMYDDQTGSERQRFSQRILSAKDPLKKSRGRIFSESCSSGTQSDEEFDDTQSDLSSDSDPDFVGSRRYRKKRIPVGSHFQADVPEWTGEASESDSKWLGTQFWPLERVEQNRTLIERERIGKGRQDSCGCQLPGSSECVRFHVSQKRMRVKLELGPAFYRWKFDNMGEDVALSWIKDEENRFHNIVKSNPLSLGKCFWPEIVKSLANKGRESLVSYYFNVFLLQRRSHQNRVTPKDINSDDDEPQASYNSAKPPGSIFCSPKKPQLNIG